MAATSTGHAIPEEGFNFVESLSQMEVLMVGELLRNEELAAKKAQVYADMAHDPELRELMGGFAHAHRQKVRGLIGRMKEFSGEGTAQWISYPTVTC